MLLKKSWLAFSSFIVLSGAAALLSSGCSGDDSGGDGDGDEVEFTFCAPAGPTCPPEVDDSALPTGVSFRDDIYSKILLTSCSGGSGCHAGSNNASGLAFGSEDSPFDDTQISALVAELKGKTSKVAGIKNVVAGDWKQSYMMMKLDGCQDQMGLSCDQDALAQINLSVCEGGCGDGMPASEGDTSNPVAYPLAAAHLETIRAWIADGAQDN